MTSTLSIIVIFTGLTLLITALGFYRPVYFVSIGYAFAITVMALATVLIFRRHISILAILHNLLLLLWGLRLGGFLLRREMRPSFQKQLREVTDQYGSISLFRKFAIWSIVSTLYVLMFLPSLVDASASLLKPSVPALFVQVAGLLLMAAGLIIEAVSDQQKSAFKTRSPQSFCNVGLYRWVRFPNYLGEIIFWTGNWVMGMIFYTTLVHWIASLLGLVCLILIMLGSTRRLERAQDQRYGNLPQYQTFIHSVGILFPFVPLYTLKNIRIYLE